MKCLAPIALVFALAACSSATGPVAKGQKHTFRLNSTDQFQLHRPFIEGQEKVRADMTCGVDNWRHIKTYRDADAIVAVVTYQCLD